MRDYSNGGFFFIDAAPIQAAGANGLKINGIFEDAKRAIKGGKVFVITGIITENNLASGLCATAIDAGSSVIIDADFETSRIAMRITSADIISLTV